MDHFSSVQLNQDGTVTLTPHDSWVGHNKIVLSKDEKYSFQEDHAYGSVTYKGVKDGQLVFEIMSGFDALSFGDNVSEHTEEKWIYPYTMEQFADGHEGEILERMLFVDVYANIFNEENKEEIMRLLDKSGKDVNYLLWRRGISVGDIKFLVKNGANINHTVGGKTILLSAIRLGEFEGYDRSCTEKLQYLQTLIDLGIDIHHKDEENQEAIDYLNEKMQKCFNSNGQVIKNDISINCPCLFNIMDVLKGKSNLLKPDNKLPNVE